MTLRVPDDSYATVADADRYHALRQSAGVWSGMDTVQKERALVTASDYLDAHYPLRGGLNAAMRSGSRAVPPEVVKAVCELAVQQDLTANEQPKQQSVRVGDVSVTYALPSEKPVQRFVYVSALLAGLLERNKGGIGTVGLARG